MITKNPPTDAQIMQTLRELDKRGDALSGDAVICIQWLQSGIAAADEDCDTKRKAIDVLTEGRGMDDDALWAMLKAERDAARERLKEIADNCQRLLDGGLSSFSRKDFAKVVLMTANSK